jgi:DNA invertase Pin-like site-specific DNA recombinase
MVYGYCRVSTKGQAKDGNSLEGQETALREAGAQEIYKDAFTGTKAERPALNELLGRLQAGDKLIVTKLDRVARSLSQGSDLVNVLIGKGVSVHILNIGILDNTPASKLIRGIFFAFAEFERDMIVERTQEGKVIARETARAKGKTFKEGRPKKHSRDQLDHAMELLADHSYPQVEGLTGISKSTLIRYKRKQEVGKND